MKYEVEMKEGREINSKYWPDMGFIWYSSVAAEGSVEVTGFIFPLKSHIITPVDAVEHAHTWKR